MMKMFRLTAVIVALLYAAPSYAQFVVEQSRIEEVVAPGNSYVNQIVLHNTTGKTRNVRIYWQDFQYKEPYTGEKEFFPAGAQQYSLSNWAAVDKDYATVPAKGSITINYSIKVPEDADGGYYGVLFFEEDNPDNVTSTGVKIVMRIGTLFFINTDGRRDHVEINDLAIEQSKLMGSILNTGKTILFPVGTYYILDNEGIVADRGEIEKRYLPAGKKAAFEAQISEKLNPGEYSAILTFDLGEGYSHVNEIYFSKDANGVITVKRITN